MSVSSASGEPDLRASPAGGLLPHRTGGRPQRGRARPRHARGARRRSRRQPRRAETIRDDGRGFSVDEVERRQREGHVGLSLLEEHAAEVHGRLTVHSTPGEGTTVRLEVPVR